MMDDAALRDMLLPGMVAMEAVYGVDLDITVNANGIVATAREPSRTKHLMLATREEIESGAYKDKFRPELERLCRELRDEIGSAERAA
jgi:hypothetical protein